jgi:hypothetical protein
MMSASKLSANNLYLWHFGLLAAGKGQEQEGER